MNTDREAQDITFAAPCVDIQKLFRAESKWHELTPDKREQQAKTNWCWAAVASSVAHYYRADTAVNQCSIADGELQRDDCCLDPPTKDDPCNVYGYLMSSLYRVAHFEKWSALQTATSSQIHEEIDAGRPLCARIVWIEGGAHLLTIAAYADQATADASGNYVVEGLGIQDPWWGWSDIDYPDFPAGYINCGTWTDTYYTKR